MIKKITIDNFMAHEHTELELGSGVTILPGRNNTGKSAVVEALRCLATNPTPKHYIRHGAKEARVGVELDDGTRVVWVRKKRSSGYELWKPGAEEPEEYWKFGRKPPEDIREILRLDQVELETGGEVDIHVGNQREPVFLLNQPASNAAAFFAASTESAHLLAMQNLLKRQTTDAKRQERDFQVQTARIEGEIDRLALLPDIELQLQAARELEKTAQNFEKIIPALESLVSTHHRLSEVRRVKESSAMTLNAVSEPPQLDDVMPLARMIEALGAVDQQRGRAGMLAGILDGLREPGRGEPVPPLAALVHNLDLATSLLRKAEVQKKVFAALESVPERENVEKLSEFIDEFISAQYRRNRFSRWEEVLRKVAEPPGVDSTESLGAMLVAMGELSERLHRVETELHGLENSLRKVEDSMEECIAELGCCPTCGGELTTAGFIDHGGRNGS